MGSYPFPRPSSLRFAPVTAQAGPEVCVIAEIGVNHDGRLDRALQLVQAAKDAGADAVKLQLFEARWLLSREASLADYQKASDSDVFTMLQRLQLSLEAMLQVRQAVRDAQMAFIVTPFSLENFDALKALEVDAVKIASPDAVNLPLLRLMASLRQPMIVSTGTAELTELAPMVQIVRDRPSCLLHCVSSYPTPDDSATLSAMAALATRYALPVGYSDHTTNPLTGALAVAAGACVIEKHLTYDRSAPGPDHAASFDPAQFRHYVQLIRQGAAMLGPRCKTVASVEREVRGICRQSVCAKRPLPVGHVLRAEDLTVRRPGTGIPAAQLESLLGKKLIRPVEAECLLHPDDLRQAG